MHPYSLHTLPIRIQNSPFRATDGELLLYPHENFILVMVDSDEHFVSSGW